MAIQSALSLQSSCLYAQRKTDAAVTVIHTSPLTVGVKMRRQGVL